jgi:hypothetical protein
MSRKRLHHSSPEEPPKSDDLTLINGIGPAVEKRLHEVGIFTFTQLAALTPADIAASVASIAGMTAERIIKQDWIGQARKLTIKSTATEIPREVETPTESVLIKTEGPRHAQTIEEEGLLLTSEVAKPGLTGTLHVRDMKIEGVESSGSHRKLSHNQPFFARLFLDFTEMTLPGNTQLNYKASIFGKSKRNFPNHFVEVAEGTINPTDTVTINVEGKSLPEGSYKLAATIILALPGKKLTPRQGTVVIVDGGILQVY